MKTRIIKFATFQPKAKEVKREWRLFDAKEKILGRLATEVAMALMGKNKRDYSPHMDNGNNVVVVNAAEIRVTGKKEEQKVYYRHSGYPGGFKEISYKKLKKDHPERIFELAVKRMLPDNRLRDKRMARLFISVDEKNPYEDKFKN
jgi:large subunit ribosomal protein L13